MTGEGSIDKLIEAFHLFDGDERPPMVLMVPLPCEEPPAANGIFQSLESQFEEDLQGFELIEAKVPSAHWEIEIRLDSGEVYILWLAPWDESFIDDLKLRAMSSGERKGLKRANYLLGLARILSGPPLAELRFCYRILSVAAPKGLGFLDLASKTCRGPRWVRDMAFSSALPSFRLLCDINAVGYHDRRSYWLHTVGLRRAGLPELEIFDVQEASLGRCKELIERAGMRFLHLGLPSEEEEFSLGGGLKLAWLWRRSLSEDPAAGFRDPCQRVPSAVLFSPVGGAFWNRLENPSLSGVFLGFEPFVDKEGIKNKKLLAGERFNRFKTLFRTYKGQEGWVFYVMLALVDQGAVEESRDIRWLRLDDMTSRGFIGRESCDEESRHYCFHFMIDWMLRSPRGDYFADDVALIEGELEESSPGRKKGGE